MLVQDAKQDREDGLYHQLFAFPVPVLAKLEIKTTVGVAQEPTPFQVEVLERHQVVIVERKPVEQAVGDTQLVEDKEQVVVGTRRGRGLGYKRLDKAPA